MPMQHSTLGVVLPSTPSASHSSTVSAGGSASAASAAAAASHHTMHAAIPAPAAPSSASSYAPSSQLLGQLVRKLASFRRGLVQERKEKKLLELSLEESLLQQSQMASTMREQDVQLMTSLELSASLEHALQEQRFAESLNQHQTPSAASASSASSSSQQQPHPPPPSNRHATLFDEREFEHIFTKPKDQMQHELTRLFKELTTIQQFYHVLEKRACSEKVSFEASNLKLLRDLKGQRDRNELVMKECTSYKLQTQELTSELEDIKEELSKKIVQHDEFVRHSEQQQHMFQNELLQRNERIRQLEDDLNRTREQHRSLLEQHDLQTLKLSTLESTLRSFQCTRICTKGENVTCQIAIKKIVTTGELVLTVKDQKPNTMPTTSTTTTTAANGMNGIGPSESPIRKQHIQPTTTTMNVTFDEYDHEYVQDISTVRCCAVYEDPSEDVMIGSNVPSSSSSASSSSLDEFVLPSARFAHLAHHRQPALSPSGFRPRFVLCFTGDNHRCIIFESETKEFRRHICEVLQQFIRMVKDKQVDELGGFFGDVSDTPAATHA